MLILALLACNGEKEEEDPEVHACEMVGEPGVSVTAGARMDSSAGTVEVGEDPFTVTLVAGAAGFVGIPVSGDTPALLFMGTADVAVELYDADGAAMGLGDPAPVEACTEIPEHYDLDLHSAGTWYLELGPAAVTEVWLLIHPGSHEHE